jgi:hypothetical protein
MDLQRDVLVKASELRILKLSPNANPPLMQALRRREAVAVLQTFLIFIPREGRRMFIRRKVQNTFQIKETIRERLPSKAAC